MASKPQSKWTTLAVGLGVLGILLHLRPLSVWLLPFTVDGQLQAETARFLDRLGVVPLGLAALALTAAASRALRTALASGWRSGPGNSMGRSWMLPLAVTTLAARLLAGAWSDVGRGDDGARVAWLQGWLANPELVPTELWAPGHLYLHALVRLVVRDAVWAGIVLGSMASAGTVWLLGREVQRSWGATAGSLAALLVAVLPVASAHGATPDVNPVFACLCVAVLTCVRRARSGPAACLWLAWICVFLAAWSRFETIFLVPAFALPLLPRWRRVVFFAAACTLPTWLWMLALYREHGAFWHVVRTLRADPTLMRPLASQLFDLAWSAWLAMPLPVVALGVLGAAMALRARRGWELVPLLVLHLSSLLAATWSTGTGNQPRYFILDGALLAATSGIFLAGMLRSSRRWGGIALAMTLALVPLAPLLFAQPGELWLRRSARLRAVADCVAATRAAPELQDAPVVWIADEAAYFFLCRHRLPAHLYHAMPRAESDPQAIAAALAKAKAALVCVRGNGESGRRWAVLRRATAAGFEVIPLRSSCDGYDLFRLTAREGTGLSAAGALASAAPAWFPPHPSPAALRAARTGEGN